MRQDHDPCADPLTPEQRRKVDAAVERVLEDMGPAGLGGPRAPPPTTNAEVQRLRARNLELVDRLAEVSARLVFYAGDVTLVMPWPPRPLPPREIVEPPPRARSYLSRVERDRDIVLCVILGNRRTDVAKHYDLTLSRVSQIVERWAPYDQSVGP